MTPQETPDCNRDAMASLAAPFCSAIDVSKLTEHDWLQVDMAARGCISGRLHEWPHLSAAFKRAGLEAQPSTGSFAVRDISRLILMLSPNVPDQRPGEQPKP
jgi:hypothetical protein